MANNTDAQNELINVPEIVPTWWYFNQSANRCSHVIYHHVIRSQVYTFDIWLCSFGLPNILLNERVAYDLVRFWEEMHPKMLNKKEKD